MSADSARWSPNGPMPQQRQVNIYEHVSNLARPHLVEQISAQAIRDALAVLNAPTGNSYETKAWAALSHLVPAAARMGGILGKVR